MNLSAIFGWMATVSPFLVQGISTGQWGGLSGLMFGFAIVGIPLSFLIAWLVVAPFVRIMMQKNVSYFRAAYWGAGIGSGLVAASIAIGRFRGWRQSLDDSFYSRIGGGDGVSSIDGILTPYGWWVLAQRSAIFIVACVLVALLVRWVIGAGRSSAKTEVKE